VLRSGDAVVVLDTEVTPELRAEGWARDAVRVIQDGRRAAGFSVTDRIEADLTVASGDLAEALDDWRDYICEQVLATRMKVTVSDSGPPGGSRAAAVDGRALHHSLSRVTGA